MSSKPYGTCQVQILGGPKAPDTPIKEIEMTTYLSNAFALSMVDDGNFSVATLTVEEAVMALSDSFTSAIGHSDIAAVVSDMLGIDVPMNRVNLALKTGDVLVVAQYVGPRLPEGATTLPEGAKIVFKMVTI